ncbi:MAG TPA: Ig-like domain-containing protein [Acidimicrobiales bacterium]|nr:Ig-like domain-containing protein [Acidimicrobiales bacterium]
MVSVRGTVRIFAGFILSAGLVLIGSNVMVSGTASAYPLSCYPPGSSSCTGKLSATPSTVARGGKVAISGRGFEAGAKVSINVCRIATVRTTATSTGHVSVLITISLKAPLGACKLTAAGLGTNKQTLTLTATVIVKRGSKTVLKLFAAQVTYGDEQIERVSVTVSPLAVGPTPTGIVDVTESKATLCVIKLSSGKGSCTLSAKQLKVGVYGVVANYGGSTTYVGSTSSTESLTVANRARTKLS